MANPIVSRAELAIGGKPMTVKGVIQKTSLLLGLSAITGVGFFFYALMAGLSQGFITMAAFGVCALLVSRFYHLNHTKPNLCGALCTLEGIF
ncbi:Bax inhibitor-1/YccA family protein [Psychrobacter sp. WY6]|uniref:Bax inhibitor-1/YccA family membrane protein n=1 Tax=Psychrobacter sp. WY6 TaxID=2708350 RepID=UPI00202302BF|nr:Bax inhibitor-1/YccA family protein [Psychrobacter sp. WY6]